VSAVEVRPLGLFLKRPPRYGINAAAVPLKPGVPSYIRITDIDDSGRFAPSPKVGVSHPAAENYLLSPGELVFARTGASVGKSYLYNSRDGELVYAGFLINIAPDPKLLNPKFLFFFAQTQAYWDWIARTSVRSGQPGVNGREYARLPLPALSIDDQNAIVDAMTGIDDLISALERMIAKKEAIKQGLMQELLTGRKRLPGFIAAWEPRKLGAIANMRSGGTPLSSIQRYYGGGIPWVSISDMTRAGKYIASTETTLTQAGLAASAAKLYEPNVVLYAMYASLGECSLAVGRVSSSQAILGIEAGPSLDREFLYYALQHLKPRVKSLGQRGTQSNLNAGMVRDLVLIVPPMDEQVAIAAVLSDADRELTALERRLTKARAIKEGMMQQLLAGRVRLRAEVAA
jgi:type I restriction enzyme S subunit